MDKLSYTHGFVFEHDKVCIASEVDRLTAAELDHTMMLQYVANQWYYFQIDFPTVGVVIVHEDDVNKTLSLGIDGRVHVASKAGMGEEHVDPTDEGPEHRGDMRRMALIDGIPYAVGMSRQVYRRSPGGVWTHIDAGMVLPAGTQEIAGLNFIDGFGQSELYAVGYYGEIWFYDGSEWRAIDSPTNLSLQAVCCLKSEKRIIACGQGGIVLEGIGSDWRAIPHDVTESTFRGVAALNDKIFLATNEALYRLVDDDLEEVDTGLRGIGTYGFLHANDGVLWSIGQRDLIFYDGERWEEVIYE